MSVGWPKRLPRLATAALVASVTSGLLAGQVVGSRPSKPIKDDQAKLATTRPAAIPILVQSPAAGGDDTDYPVERQGLISGLIGSKHDFTQEGQVGRDLCLPCHTPHLVSPPAPRLDRRPTTTQPLQPYESPNVVLTGWSLLCLGCHDGVAAQDVYSSAHAATLADQLANSRLGTRGLRSHPVGVRYPSAAPGYHAPAAVESAGLMLPDGRIQCTTCHDAHNTLGHVGMLRVSNERSRLCLTCHRL
jgi:predicted CXXCH cytochrome family protein